MYITFTYLYITFAKTLTLKWFLRWKNVLYFFLHNLKDIMVISNRAKFHFENLLKERLYFVFWSGAIKVDECKKNE